MTLTLNRQKHLIHLGGRIVADFLKTMKNHRLVTRYQHP